MKKLIKKPKKELHKTIGKRKAADSGEKKYVLQLFVAGILPNSIRAIENVNNICEKYLHGKYELEIIDIYYSPSTICP